MARVFVKLFMSTVKVLGRSVHRSIMEEIRDSQKAAQILRASKKQEDKKVDMSSDEACQILNVQKDPLCKDEINMRYEHLYTINKNISFYLQCKVVRARDRLLRDLLEESSKKFIASKKWWVHLTLVYVYGLKPSLRFKDSYCTYEPLLS